MLELSSSVTSLLLALAIFFVKGLKADTQSVNDITDIDLQFSDHEPVNAHESVNASKSIQNTTDIDLHFSDHELQCFYLKENLDEARKREAECQYECANLHESYKSAKAELELCETDLKKFAALNAVRVRISFVENAIGKAWMGGRGPESSQQNPADAFNYHRDLWMWIFDGAKDDRATTLKNHVRNAGLEQSQFCDSIAGAVISTSFMGNLKMTAKLPKYTTRDIIESLKNSSLDATLVKAMEVVMKDELLLRTSS